MHIESKYITISIFLVTAASGCIVAGFFCRVYFIPAVLFAAAYIVADKKCLRCPNCGGFTNLDRLLYAKKHPYHCSNCGEQIYIR